MWVLEDNSRHHILAQESRKTVVERYALEKVAHRYLTLYQDILGRL